MVLVYLKNLVARSNSLETTPEGGRYSRSRRNDICKSKSKTSPPTSELQLPTTGPSISPLLQKQDFDYPNPTEAESYFSRIDPRVISDATIGLSDGLTVPFALTAGLSALGDSKIVISGGLAELIAGAISMGLGGWLAARSEADAYRTLLRSTNELVYNEPDYAAELLRESLAPLAPFMRLENLNVHELAKISNSSRVIYPPSTSGSFRSCENSTENLHLNSDDESHAASGSTLANLLMRYHHCSPSAPAQGRAYMSALTIAAAYFSGGFIPLAPYFFIPEVGRAFWWSVVVMAVALGCFGAGKTWLTSISAAERMGVNVEVRSNRQYQETASIRRLHIWRIVLEIGMGGGQMILLGGLAAAASIGLVVAFNRGVS